MEKSIRSGLVWRYTIDYSNGDIEKIIEDISKEFSEAEYQPVSIEINTNNFGIVIAGRLRSMGLPIMEMRKITKGWVYSK